MLSIWCQSKILSFCTRHDEDCENSEPVPINLALTLSQTTYLDSSKLKEFADNNFSFDENGKKLSKRVENAVGKGEIARYEQFLLFPQRFPTTCNADT